LPLPVARNYILRYLGTGYQHRASLQAASSEPSQLKLGVVGYDIVSFLDGRQKLQLVVLVVIAVIKLLSRIVPPTSEYESVVLVARRSII
jgi:hypothetical protein